MIYNDLEIQYTTIYKQLLKKYNLFSWLRLGLVVFILYSFYKSVETSSCYYIFGCLFAIVLFFVLMRYHNKIARKRELYEQLLKVNANERTYVKGEGIPFPNGVEYIDFKHLYSYDLDFFGENSLYHNLNRTTTFIGGDFFANLLLKPIGNNQIIDNQEAIEELSTKVKWRQNMMALGQLKKDSKEDFDRLMLWSKQDQKLLKLFNWLIYVMPVLFTLSFVGACVINVSGLITSTIVLLMINLVIAYSQFSKISKELMGADKVSEFIKQYALILEQIEKEVFQSRRLKDLQSVLVQEDSSATSEIKKLSNLFLDLESISNFVVAFFFNGSALYHIHKLRDLLEWKNQHGSKIKAWLTVIGEFETLNSLANFKYNNQDFVFPELNEDFKIDFSDIGHPLIPSFKRITNNITFLDGEFVILTGSNMSGKSTFLRTLGQNMVLASVGSVVCATKANIHPLDVIVSMRQTDNLIENESYFYAEVKRLKQLIDELSVKKCFVLLDEILKGTNSDDKQSGTIAVIKKIISTNAIGIIATHDLEVCKITDQYPDKLTNKCFEAQIITDDLVFDYKLKNGICKNKSASFLMRKMDVI